MHLINNAMSHDQFIFSLSFLPELWHKNRALYSGCSTLVYYGLFIFLRECWRSNASQY